jgi:rubrerythrin
MVKQRAYAWRQFYEARAEEHHVAYVHVQNFNHIAEDATVPTHMKTLVTDMGKELKKKWDCPICADFIPDGELDITNCGHFHCKQCIADWVAKCKADHKPKWECPVCKREHKFKAE